MDRWNMLDMLKISLRGVTDLLDDTALEQAVDVAGYETGWSLPLEKPFRIYWYGERAVRAAIAMMVYDTAHAFKFKQINLQQRWEHYSKTLNDMDKAFALAKKENPTEFMEENPDMASIIAGFGHYYAPEFIASYR